MLKILLQYPPVIFILLLILGCKSQSYSIQTACERTSVGNYRLKWDSYPPLKGDVYIEAADSPNDFDQNTDRLVVNADLGVTTYVTKNNLHRKFFRISFPKARISRVVAARSLLLEDNTRVWDLGGFYNSTGIQCTRWGILYCAHEPSHISRYDRSRFEALDIHKEVVLCGSSPCKTTPDPTASKIYLSSDTPFDVGHIIEQIGLNSIGRDGVLNLIRQLYLSFANERNDQFADALRLLCNAQYRPILFESADVPARIGFLSALILSVCEVPDYQIVSEFAQMYRPSSSSKWQKRACTMTIDQQMTLTTLLQPNEEFLQEVLNIIRSRYGSVSNYLTKHLDFSPKEQEALKKAVLVQAYDRME